MSLKTFLDFSKLCLSQNPIASHRTYSRMILYCVLGDNQFHLIEIILRDFKTAPSPKFDCVITNWFSDISRSCRSRISIAINRNYSETILKCVLAKNGSQHTESNSTTITKRFLAETRLYPTEVL